MAQRIDSIEINNIAIIDDEPDVRSGWEEPVADLALKPVPQNGPLGELTFCIENILKNTDAALCDYHLKVKAYSVFNGAILVAKLYERHFPAVLCTNWNSASVDEMRPFRRQIASLVDPKTLTVDPTILLHGLESCVMEFKGSFRTVRRPWRTLIRIEDMPEQDGAVPFVYVAVPAWGSEIVRLPKTVFPADIFPKLKPDFRLYAKVNLGAIGNEELFFEDWE
jgi:hypothetical protein